MDSKYDVHLRAYFADSLIALMQRRVAERMEQPAAYSAAVEEPEAADEAAPGVKPAAAEVA